MSLETLISDNCNEQRTCCIEVQNGFSKGEIYMESGNVVHAIIDGDIGEDAFRRILRLDKGTFRLFSEQKPSNYTITKNINKLLLESTKTIDENRLDFDWANFDLNTEELPIQKVENKLEAFVNALKSFNGVLGVAVYSTQTENFKNNTNLDSSKVAAFIRKTKHIAKLFHAVRLNYAVLQNNESMILINYGLDCLVLNIEQSEINETLINNIKSLIAQYK